MRKAVFLLLAAAFALPAQMVMNDDWAFRPMIEKSPRHREWVTIKHDGRSVETFVAYPEVANKAPVVLVIHEIFGMSNWAELVADEFAAAGYIAIAPDLLSGAAPGGGGTRKLAPGDVGQAIGKLPADQITADLNAAADYGIKRCPPPTANCSWLDFATAVARRSASLPTVPTSPRLSSSMERLRPRPIWRESKRLFSASTPMKRCANHCNNSRYHKRR